MKCGQILPYLENSVLTHWLWSNQILLKLQVWWNPNEENAKSGEYFCMLHDFIKLLMDWNIQEQEAKMSCLFTSFTAQRTYGRRLWWTRIRWELLSPISVLSPAQSTFQTQRFEAEKKRNRREETLSGETNNVQNNTKHWGWGWGVEFPQSSAQPVSREVERAVLGFQDKD